MRLNKRNEYKCCLWFDGGWDEVVIVWLLEQLRVTSGELIRGLRNEV